MLCVVGQWQNRCVPVAVRLLSKRSGDACPADALDDEQRIRLQALPSSTNSDAYAALVLSAQAAASGATSSRLVSSRQQPTNRDARLTLQERIGRNRAGVAPAQKVAHSSHAPLVSRAAHRSCTPAGRLLQLPLPFVTGTASLTTVLLVWRQSWARLERLAACASANPHVAWVAMPLGRGQCTLTTAAGHRRGRSRPPPRRTHCRQGKV
jgi:hypothetical protein